MTTITIDREVLEQAAALLNPDRSPSALFHQRRDCAEAIRAALAAPATALVVTKNESGQIVAVTRQDEDGRIVEVLAESSPAPASEPVAWMTDEIQPRVASDYTKSNMPSAVAVSFSIPLYRVSPATAPDQPAWHDAPTCAGVWLSDRGYENPYRWGTYNVVDPAHEKGMTLEDERWFGPIPEDKP